MEASENMALFGGNAMVQSAGGWGMECVWGPTGGSSWESRLTKGLVHHAQNSTFRWWEALMGMTTWKSRHFCGYLYLWYSFCALEGIKLLFFSHLLQHHPKVTLWTLLHSTWSTHAPDSDSHLSPPAGKGVWSSRLGWPMSQKIKLPTSASLHIGTLLLHWTNIAGNWETLPSVK